MIRRYRRTSGVDLRGPCSFVSAFTFAWRPSPSLRLVRATRITTTSYRSAVKNRSISRIPVRGTSLEKIETLRPAGRTEILARE